MNKTYVIRWKSKVNGRIGKGTRRFEKDEAESLVTELNQEFPDIDHEVVAAGSEDFREPAEETTRERQGAHVFTE